MWWGRLDFKSRALWHGLPHLSLLCEIEKRAGLDISLMFLLSFHDSFFESISVACAVCRQGPRRSGCPSDSGMHSLGVLTGSCHRLNFPHG